MTQALSGAAIAAVIAVCWLLGRPRPKILRSTDTSAVAALNRGQMELVLDRPIDLGPGAEAATAAAMFSGCWPRDARERSLLLRELEHQYAAGGEARRQAIALAAAWCHRSALPLIRRGLRDSDPAVMAVAAEAMAAFRGRPTPIAPTQAAAKLPRNVSRTR